MPRVPPGEISYSLHDLHRQIITLRARIREEGIDSPHHYGIPYESVAPFLMGGLRALEAIVEQQLEYLEQFPSTDRPTD